MATLKLPEKWDRHHIFWERSAYSESFERRFRNRNELVVATPRTNHTRVHAALSPPPKPTQDMMWHLIGYLQVTPVNVQQEHLATWGLERSIEFFSETAHTSNSPESADRAQNIYQHLARQAVLLTIKVGE